MQKIILNSFSAQGVRGYDVMTRKVVKNMLIFDRSMRTIIEHSPEGLEFAPGNAADMLSRLSGSHILARAIVNWNSLGK